MEPKDNLPPQKPEKPEPIPGNRKEEKFNYVTFSKEGRNFSYHIFRNIIEGVSPQDWRVIHVSENHPQIKRLLREGKLQEKKQFTIHYGKVDEEEINFFLTFYENNQELEIIEV